MKNYLVKILIILFIIFTLQNNVFAQNTTINASKIVSRAEMYFSPKTGSFVEGSTFEVPIFINTKGNNINGVEIRINFDKNKLSIVKPTSGNSIIGIWVEPPKYDNVKGNASFVGLIPDGIVTESGLIGTITFKAITTGSARVSIGSDTNIYLNNGLGTEIGYDSIKADYNIIPKAPDGIVVTSDTHSFQDEWYNNKNLSLNWDNDNSIEGYSYELDNKPYTVPDNEIDSNNNTKSYENLNDGLWYFHIKAKREGVWSNTTNFLARIDTVPPAEFKPSVNYVVASVALVERTLVSFFTTDNASGIDHYEIGIIDKSQPVTESPVFIQAESPYQLPTNSGSKLKVIVRAIDKAHNVRDVSIDVEPPQLIMKFISDYLIYILLFIIAFGFTLLMIHYLFGHHIIRNIKRIKKMLMDDSDDDHYIDNGGGPNISNNTSPQVNNGTSIVQYNKQ